MKYRIIQNTYENAEIGFIIQVRRSSNVGWVQESGRIFDKEKDAEDWILAQIDAEQGKNVISYIILSEYE
jgi:hypothetical protein